MENNLLAANLGERGRKKALAESINVSKQTVSDWIRKGAVSSEHAAKVAVFTGIPKEVLCPGFDWGTSATQTPDAPKQRAKRADRAEGAREGDRERRVGEPERRKNEPDRRVSDRSIAERAAREKQG